MSLAPRPPRSVLMPPPIVTAIRLLLFGALCMAPSRSAANTVYDVTADWSDTANPNGPWAYNEGVNLLPHVAAWQGLSGDFTSAQPAYARFEVGTSNLPCIFQSSATVGITHDWVTGDVVCHTTDDVNGIGSGPANITWTSPITGIVAVSGDIWMGRDIGRGNHWAISHNGIVLTSGDVFSGDAYSRATPFSFADGSGGAAALTSINVALGDVIQLELTRTAAYGDYSGMRMQVQLVYPTGVEVSSAPAFRLAPAAPNPLRGSTEVRFSLSREESVTLTVFDLGGRLVQRLASGEQAAGEHLIRWHPHVADGLYFLVLETPEGTQTRRVAVIH